MTATPDDRAELAESLRLARRELRLARGEQEAAVETLQKVRRQRAALREQVRLYSEALADLLSANHRDAHPGGLRGLISRGGSSGDQQDLVAEVEAAEEFDAAWYLRHNPDVVDERISAAAHYVRTGGGERRDPGPGFDTGRYLHEHPEAHDAELPPLLHYLRARRADAG